MAIFTVTTGDDIVDANDGKLSLREAIAMAQASGGSDTIGFDLSGYSGGDNVYLKSSLKIASGNNVTIDGATGEFFSAVTMDGNYKGNPFINDGFTMVEIASGATVKLMNLGFTNGFERGTAGIDGVNGTDGLKGNDGKGDTGNPGSNGNGGSGGTSAISGGGMGVAGIQNAGTLTLDRVDMAAMNAVGGAGGIGGNGGSGGSGGKGAPNKAGVGGGGGAGGPASDGGNGSHGGVAVGAIYNTGTLTMIDSTIGLATAYGSDAGRGGAGGYGGAGGAGGSSAGSKNHGGYGGYGGGGGNGGFTGNGGDAASAILNAGTLIGKSTIASFRGIESAGVSGIASGGPGGGGGQGGNGDPRGDNGVAGTGGKAGSTGLPGQKADGTHILGSYGSLVFSKNTFVIETTKTEVDEGGVIQFLAHRLGDSAAAASVDWTITGLGAADFEPGQKLTDTLKFEAGENVKIITIYADKDGLAEGNETFTLALGKASAGTALGFHKAVAVTIDDENQPPASMSLSKTTVAFDAKIGTVVGTFSGVDPDGDDLDFTLLSNPGSFFKVVNDQLVVAKALNFAQHSYGLFVEADDGHGGSFDKSFTVKLAGFVDGSDKAETLQGSSGADHIFGYGGIDTLNGLASADYLDGGNDADKMHGGTGDDMYVVDNAGDLIFEAAGEGTADKVVTAVSYALNAGAFVEILQTTSGAGTSAINLYGNETAQSMIAGNNGDNRIDGKGGADTLRGLGGADTFVFGSKPGGGNIDTIVDFKPTDDRFLLSDAIFTALTPGTITADQFRANNTGEARDATDRIVYDKDSGGIFYDADGLGGVAGVQFATVGLGLAITNADFVVV